VALRTQQIIAHESGVTDTADPLGGSYAVEQLTDEIEERALQYMQTIDGLGGALSAVETGFIQQEIQESAYRAQKAIEAREAIVIGVNDYTIDEKVPIELLRVDPAIEQAQRQSLTGLRLKRDPAQVEAHLERLTAAAEAQDNLMPHFIACVEADVTLGEICGRLRRLWGEYQAPSTL
jgi:methylmalonyl-CoA mutase N-terminal domain/subunit